MSARYRHTLSAGLFASVLLAAAGCAAEGADTFAEVVIDGTEPVRLRTRALEVIVLAEPERALLLSEVVRVPQDVEFPARMVFAPTGPGTDHVFHVIARAFEGPRAEETLVAGQLLLGGFAPGGWTRFDMLLDEEDLGAAAEVTEGGP